MAIRTARALVLTAAGLALAFASAASAAEDAGPLAAVKAFFAAAAIDDEPGFAAVAAPGFEAYDNGEVYRGMSLLKAVEGFHRAGVKIVWSVQDAQADTHGDVAFVRWINRGSIDMGKGQGPQAVTWLESAWLQRIDGVWRVEFLHSGRRTES